MKTWLDRKRHLSQESFGWLALAAAIAGFAFAFRDLAENVDFVAFRCGGAAMMHHVDPYLTTSLTNCENTTLAAFGKRLSVAAVPAPFPGYALAFFALLALPSPAVACILWQAMLIVAFIAVIFLMCRTTQLRPLLVCAALLTPFCTEMLILGQVVPLMLLGFAATFVCLREKRESLAGYASLLTMLEPNIGLVFCLALFVNAPRSRAALALGATVLAGVTLSVLPWPVTVEYFRLVLPTHGLSEVFFIDQYGVAHLLSLLGCSPVLALHLASCIYAVVATAGITISARIRRACGDAVPALAFVGASTTLSSPYLHLHQLCACALFAVVLYARTRRNAELAIVAALGLPFTAFTSSHEAPLFYAAAFALSLIAAQRSMIVLAAINIGGFMLIAIAERRFDAPQVMQRYHAWAVRYAAATPLAPQLPEHVWFPVTALMSSNASAPTMFLYALPWIALVLLVSGLGRIAVDVPDHVADGVSR